MFDENAAIAERYALELEMGFTEILKMRVGIEFEKERLDEPESIDEANDFDDLQLSELGVELIWVLSPREGDGGGYGLVAEIERPTDDEESSSLILGPIIEFQSGHWFAAAVPMLVYAFGGEADEGEKVDNKWDFAYAAQVTYSFSPRWSSHSKATGRSSASAAAAILRNRRSCSETSISIVSDRCSITRTTLGREEEGRESGDRPWRARGTERQHAGPHDQAQHRGRFLIRFSQSDF